MTELSFDKCRNHWIISSEKMGEWRSTWSLTRIFSTLMRRLPGIKGIQGFLCSAKDRETIDFRHDVSVNLKACRARGRDFVPMLTKKTVYQYSIYFINRELMSLRFHIFTDCVCIKITVTGGIGDQYRWIHYALCKMTEA